MSSKTVIVVVLVLLLAGSLLVEARRDKQSRKASKKTRKAPAPQYLTPDQPQFWANSLLAAFLALAGGFCSGMTVGLNSLSVLNLEIMQRSSDSQTKFKAERILGVISDHHLFLTTLLVGNAIVLQSLPLVIHLIMPDWAAILFSTVVVLVVAEVVPMSWSTGTHKYTIAFYGAPLVSLMIKLFYPLCYPMARGLDRLLGGDHEQRILRRDFLTFINDKRKNQLDELEIAFINQIMNHRDKTLKNIMTPLQDLYMLEEQQLITKEVIDHISQLQYSYILVFKEKQANLKGYIKTKQLILAYLQVQQPQLPLYKLISNIKTGLTRVCHDAIATEALEVLELHQDRLLLVTDQQKHQEQHSSSGISVVSVFEAQEWIVNEGSILGVVTLNQLLYEMADYPQALKVSQRKVSSCPS